MFWNKPRARRDKYFDELVEGFSGTDSVITQNDNLLLAKSESFEFEIYWKDSSNFNSRIIPIQTEIALRCSSRKVDDSFLNLSRELKGDEGRRIEALMLLNKLASLGSMYVQNEKIYYGSRFTLYEGDSDAVFERVCKPLLASSIIHAGNDLLLYAFARNLSTGVPPSKDSLWTQTDFDQMKKWLDPKCICTAGSDGLSAQFELKILGDLENVSTKILDRIITVAPMRKKKNTAMFTAEVSHHPILGGGLLLLLQMPYVIEDRAKLALICSELNKLEMSSEVETQFFGKEDNAQHFGAWTEGGLGGNLSYVSFIPNSLHKLGLGLNMSFWFMRRAQVADSLILELLNLNIN